MKWLIITLLLALTGCASQSTEGRSVGSECSVKADCILPLDFAIQSNCPFEAHCVHEQCVVVCPYVASSCESDSECVCKDRGPRSIECVCESGRCVSIEAK